MPLLRLAARVRRRGELFMRRSGKAKAAALQQQLCLSSGRWRRAYGEMRAAAAHSVRQQAARRAQQEAMVERGGRRRFKAPTASDVAHNVAAPPRRVYVYGGVVLRIMLQRVRRYASPRAEKKERQACPETGKNTAVAMENGLE